MSESIRDERGRVLNRDEHERFSSRERELDEFRELLEIQQREFDAYRKRAQEEQLAREAALQKEQQEREKMFTQREKQLMMRHRDVEERLMKRQAEVEHLRNRLQSEIVEREERLHQAQLELALDKERYNEESRKKIERTSKDYVADALETLDRKEGQFHRISKIWSGVGAASLVAAIAFFSYVTLSTAISVPHPISWEFLAFAVFKGFIAIALLAGLAKYSFLLGNSYMQEALKNGDRRHAINFGKFYLESYGAAAEWSQVKEAFEHWNITGTNAFKRSDDSMPDISAIEKAIALVERAGKALPKLNGHGSGT
ncbi:hypothetical protein KAF81_32610 [Pseudomonas aeruginosa]|uniref:hypothetical protein n=1 Tax=Pseudomonadota TaxID=1224 RepID=UPI0012A9074B|nr:MULTISPECIES: hypothetical protein [Pseudomonadota]MBP8322387.1 hypothetical protein [Pseudomonas aeruginosa]CUR69131.1 hypothetical protein BN2877_45680 [Achromobacter xylosoxidans]